MKRVLTLLVLTMALAPSAFAAAPSGSAGMTHRMMLLMIQLGLIVFAARLGCMLFQRLKMPGVLGELCAGMVLGPYMIGGVPLPGFAQGIFPAGPGFPLSPELYGICCLAAIILLFMAGLETDLKLFLRFSIAGTLVGLGGVIVSFIVGDLITVLFSGMLFGEPLGFFAPRCLFLGVLSTATSVGITARVLSDKRKLDSPEGVTILAGAVIDDVLGIILLAVVLGVIAASHGSRGVDWGHIGIIAVKALGIWLAATALGLTFAKRIGKWLKWFSDRTAITIMALGLALVVSGLFEEAGLAMIVGAYVTGLSLSRTDISRVIQENLDPVYRLLVPVFFCAMGMLVDFSALGSPPVLVFGAVYTALAVAAKIAGCSLPAFFCNFNLRGAARIGTGMVPRGEVALIMAGIGLAGNVLDPQSFGVAVMMTVVTTLLAPILLVALFKNPATGTRREIKSRDESILKYQFPTSEVAELMMNRITDAFASEGFYIHLLEHDNHDLYQLRQNDIIITLHRKDSDIVFSCGKPDEHLISAAVYEVLCEFRQLISQLNKPIDQKAIEQKLQRDGTSEKGRMLDLSKYINPSLIIPDLQAGTKKKVIEELLDVLCKNGIVQNRGKALKALLDREKVVSTGMQHGIAFPHAKSDEINAIVCAVGLKPNGIDFDSIDGEPSRIFILELAPSSAGGPHLQFMSTVSQILDRKTRSSLLEKTHSPQAICAVFTA